jgi:hypothetical protein
MHFLVDHNRKVAFGWSGKAGCRHVKMLFAYLTNSFRVKRTSTNDPEWVRCFDQQKNRNALHQGSYGAKVPAGYKVIMFVRDPYARFRSSYIRCMREAEAFKLGPDDSVTTVLKAIRSNTHANFMHHFGPQTAEAYGNVSEATHDIVAWDISNIPYSELERMYKVVLPSTVRAYTFESTPIANEPRMPHYHITPNEDALVRDLFAADFALYLKTQQGRYS